INVYYIIFAYFVHYIVILTCTQLFLSQIPKVWFYPSFFEKAKCLFSIATLLCTHYLYYHYLTSSIIQLNFLPELNGTTLPYISGIVNSPFRRVTCFMLFSNL